MIKLFDALSHKRRSSFLASTLTFAFLAVLPLQAPAQAADTPPDVTANADGSCVFHKRLASAGDREDINVANGATYHRAELKGKKTGIIYRPHRT
jgi:hypothetical protein